MPKHPFENNNDDDFDDFDGDLGPNEFEIDITYKYGQPDNCVELSTVCEIDMDDPGASRNRMQSLLDFLMRSVPRASLDSKDLPLVLNENGKVSMLPAKNSGGGGNKRRRGRRGNKKTGGGGAGSGGSGKE